MQTQKTHVEVEVGLIWTETPTITTTTRSCSKHGCSHQRQPGLSEELLRSLQQLASGLSEGASHLLRQQRRIPAGGTRGAATGDPAQSAVSSLQDGLRQHGRAARVSFHSTNLVSCWFAACTRRLPRSIKNVCILNNLLHK